MLYANNLNTIEEQLQRMEVTTNRINNWLETIENNISEGEQRLRKVITLNRPMMLSVLDKMLCDLEKIKNELQKG